MKAIDSWFPFFGGDYVADTMHLNTEEHGAYLLLLVHAWRAPLPDDDKRLANITKLSLRAWRRAAVALRPFFQARDGALFSKRLEEIRADQMGKVVQRQAAGRASALARWGAGKAEQAEAAPIAPAAGTAADNGTDNCAGNDRITAVVTADQRRGSDPEPESESEREEKKGSGLRPGPAARTAPPMQRVMLLPLMPGDGDAERVASDEIPQERINREAYREARMILGRLVPDMSDKAKGLLIGWGNKEMGVGPLAVVHCLRDVERDVAAGMLHGDINGAIRGYIRQRATGGRRKGDEKVTFGTLLRDMAERGEWLDDDDGAPAREARHA